MSEYADPFGLADCESELEELHEEYQQLYFGNTPFNVSALNQRTYLIIGRRGAGKTALSHYFSFQNEIRNALVIDVDEPKEYQKVLTEIAKRSSYSSELAVPYARDIWIYLIWCLIFENTKSVASAIAQACIPCERQVAYTHGGFLNSAIDWLVGQFRGGTFESNSDSVSEFLKEGNFAAARESVLGYAKTRPLFVAVDTLEKYDIADSGLMNAIAGLVEAAADFNIKYAKHGVHIKVFVSGEIYPHLMESALQNPLKSVKHPVHMLWRAKDLLRLIAWRYYRFLRKEKLALPISLQDIDWDSPRDVLHKVWVPYFGQNTKNKRGEKEHTFAYVLRHTQMRPRQLIELCNSISARSLASGNFPLMSGRDLIEGIEDGEAKLATEIINSYSKVHEGVADIVNALSKLPMTFLGSELDRRAPESASHWKVGGYSPSAFSRLVVELGIVGRVLRQSSSGHITAEFEYSQRAAMRLGHRDECVIHPMFFSRLNIEAPVKPLMVMPFVVEAEESAWLNGNE
jgi:hypothetical protein